MTNVVYAADVSRPDGGALKNVKPTMLHVAEDCPAGTGSHSE
jgi:hypothetical protein